MRFLIYVSGLLSIAILAMPMQAAADVARKLPNIGQSGPHGGILERAKHAGPHAHPQNNSAILYFELVRKGNDLTIYPYVLPRGKRVLKALSAEKRLPETTVRVTSTNGKQDVPVTKTVTPKAIEAKFGPLPMLKAEDRLVVHVAAIYKGFSHTTKFEIEKEPSVAE